MKAKICEIYVTTKKAYCVLAIQNPENDAVLLAASSTAAAELPPQLCSLLLSALPSEQGDLRIWLLFDD